MNLWFLTNSKQQLVNTGDTQKYEDAPTLIHTVCQVQKACIDTLRH